MKRKWISRVIFLVIASTFSIGYATWTIVDNAVATVSGNIDSENVKNVNQTKLIKISVDNQDGPFEVSPSGFNIDEELKTTVSLKVDFILINNTCNKDIINYECRLKVDNIKSAIDGKLTSFDPINASLIDGYNSGFGPFGGNVQEHISHITITKGEGENTEFSLIYVFTNFSELINRDNLGMYIQLVEI